MAQSHQPGAVTLPETREQYRDHGRLQHSLMFHARIGTQPWRGVSAGILRE
jgi:hypothetical protein